MEPGKLYDYFALICVGAIVGIWFAMDAMTHDLVVNQKHPCQGCAKRIEREAKDNG